MDENKIERKVAYGQTELPSKSKFPTKCLWGENVVGLPLSSPPLNNHGTTELKTFTSALKHMLSFRKDALTSVTEESTEGKINEMKKKMKDAEGKTELELEPASPTKWMECEDSNGLAQKSPPFHKQEENEPQLFTSDIKQMFSFRKHRQKSFKEELTEDKTDENRTEKEEEDGKTELELEPASPAKWMECEDSNGLAKKSPTFPKQEENEPKLFTRDIKQKLSFRKHRQKSFKEDSVEVEMDETKTEMKEEDGKTELELEPASPAKWMECEDSNSLAQKSPPFHKQEKNEPKLFTRDIKQMLSFRKHRQKSFKEELTEVKTDENRTEKEKEDGKTELELEPASPAKWMECEDSNGLAQKSPPFHKQEKNEPKLLTRDIKQMLSFRKHRQKSFKVESAEVKTDENKTEKEEEDGKTELSLKQEFLVKSMETENGNCLSTVSLVSDNPGNNEPKSSNKSVKAKLSFRSNTSVSVKEETIEVAGISRYNSKRFKVGFLKLIKDSDQIKEESNSIPKKNEEFEGEAGVLKEPLSVMEIHEQILKRQLLEAFRNISGIEIALLAEGEAKKYEDTPKEYTMRVKDVNLLYDAISKEIQQIVEKTLDLPRLELKGLITEMVALIEEEEKTHTGAINIPVPIDPVKQLGLARNWGKLWKRTVKESVKRRIDKVPIPLQEDNASWLSVHLGFLQTVIKEDLFTIMHWVQKFYPREFNVCATYLTAFHEALASHLQRILEEEESGLNLCQFYALLHWVTNVYYSEDCLGHPDLRPEIKTEDLPSLLTPDVMDKLKNGYINSLKWKTKSYLENILHLEREKWNSEEQLEALQSSYHSSLSFDIQKLTSEHVKVSGKICRDLERATLEITVKEVTDFIPCFGKAFLEWDHTKDCPQFASLMVAYMNDFHDLRTGFKKTFNINCEEMERTLADLILRYKKYFFNKLKTKTQPMFKKILSQTWMLHSGTLDLFIMKILLVVDDLSKDLKNLKSPMCQDFLNEVHKYVVKEYIRQILKPRGGMKKIKREKVSNIMHHEAKTINNTMQDLGSSADWLFPAILYIADIIGEKKKDKIKDYIKDLTQDYPDIRKEHISAILALRGLGRNKRKTIADQMDGPSKELEFGSDQILFADIEFPNTACCL